MSCQPPPSKSATHTPGPNSSRLIEMPSFPLKCLNLMPAAAVTFVNSIDGTGAFCADSVGTKGEQIAANASIRTRTQIGQSRGLQLLLECGDMVSLRFRLASVAAFYMYFR